MFNRVNLRLCILTVHCHHYDNPRLRCCLCYYELQYEPVLLVAPPVLHFPLYNYRELENYSDAATGFATIGLWIISGS